MKLGQDGRKMGCQHEERFSLEGPDCPWDTDGPSVRQWQEIDGALVLLDLELGGLGERYSHRWRRRHRVEAHCCRGVPPCKSTIGLGLTGVRAALTSWYQTGVLGTSGRCPTKAVILHFPHENLRGEKRRACCDRKSSPCTRVWVHMQIANTLICVLWVWGGGLAHQMTDPE